MGLQAKIEMGLELRIPCEYRSSVDFLDESRLFKRFKVPMEGHRGDTQAPGIFMNGNPTFVPEFLEEFFSSFKRVHLLLSLPGGG